ncbi:hypothetical protein HZA40_00925 [Candidatus Peregrinibacteria bacterium]|nr:hypothetical protein [Candidatus Peregrinibacteria bacterium]
MGGNNQPSGNIETQRAVKAEEKESNLSETARLVNGMMKEYIMPVLRDSGLVATANEIIKARLEPDDAKVIEFSLTCRAKQAEISAKAQEAGCDEKQLAVIPNYFSKLLGSVKSAGNKESV